jgi:phytoene synthase
VLEVFLDAVERHKIPHRLPIDLIEGARMDLDHPRYGSFSELREYCNRASGTMSMLMAHLIGYRGPALEYMAELGVAMELTSILRTLGDSLARGHVYLPLDEIEAFGYSQAELFQHERNSAFRTLMGFQAERARSYYQKVAPGLDLLDRRGRFAVRVAYDLSVSTLSRIEASDFDVFERRPNLPVVERYWITARSLAVPMTRRLWRSMSA